VALKRRRRRRKRNTARHFIRFARLTCAEYMTRTGFEAYTHSRTHTYMRTSTYAREPCAYQHACPSVKNAYVTSSILWDGRCNQIPEFRQPPYLPRKRRADLGSRSAAATATGCWRNHVIPRASSRSAEARGYTGTHQQSCFPSSPTYIVSSVPAISTVRIYRAAPSHRIASQRIASVFPTISELDRGMA
jgi:hypothetical protein